MMTLRMMTLLLLLSRILMILMMEILSLRMIWMTMRKKQLEERLFSHQKKAHRKLLRLTVRLLSSICRSQGPYIEVLRL